MGQTYQTVLCLAPMAGITDWPMRVLCYRMGADYACSEMVRAIGYLCAKPGTAASGMPILDVDMAQNVVVMKRGRGRGYAGIENEVYFKDNTQMLFGDGKAGLQAVIAAAKEPIS